MPASSSARGPGEFGGTGRGHPFNAHASARHLLGNPLLHSLHIFQIGDSNMDDFLSGTVRKMSRVYLA